jgi:hypothetical protein
MDVWDAAAHQISVSLFRGVENAAALYELAKVVEGEDSGAAGASRCVVVDLGNVVSELHLRSAVLKAILCATPDSGFRGKSASFRANVLFHLAATGKISDTVAQFCISAASTSVAVLGWTHDATSLAEYHELVAAVQGTAFDPALLLRDSEFINDEKKHRLVKLFKITPQELEVAEGLEDCVITRLAVKEIL